MFILGFSVRVFQLLEDMVSIFFYIVSKIKFSCKIEISENPIFLFYVCIWAHWPVDVTLKIFSHLRFTLFKT